MGTAAGENGGGSSGKKKKEEEERDHHPYDYHVSGPRDLASPHWRDLICSSWRNPSYKRIAIACFVQAAYLLELDRQANRTGAYAIAPRWWKQFKYKLVRSLVDERDGSIYGAVFEFDHNAAMADFLPFRPWGAPKVAVAFRGTIIRGSTIRRDMEDDLRLVTWDCVKGSVRFRGALESVKSMISKHGSQHVCIGGHSLGAGIALHVGKELAKQNVFIDCHLFNPPSVSLPTTLRYITKRASFMWRGKRNGESGRTGEGKLLNGWMPSLYINDLDYICMHYADRSGGVTVTTDNRGKGGGVGISDNRGKGGGGMFLAQKGTGSFMEAHGLEQWWSSDGELKRAVSDSRLLSRQLRNLYLENGK
ncbi:hypothetical protein LUZ60_009962 [Juncus effusus]|nr:hypothetical protein LUZ60_009962 [Juncus effusus]